MAHSAGGWLGRAFIGQAIYKGGIDSSDEEPHEAVASLITLGTPHTPLPPEKVGRRWAGGRAGGWPFHRALRLRAVLRGSVLRVHGQKLQIGTSANGRWCRCLCRGAAPRAGRCGL